MSPRRSQHASLNAMFQLNSWIPLLSASSRLAVGNGDSIARSSCSRACNPAAAAEAAAASIATTQAQDQGLVPIQPLEPMLLPKLRIDFADFPWSHCSIDQRLFTSESGCGYRYGQLMREDLDLWRGFLKNSQGTERCEGTPLSLCVQAHFLQLKCDSRRQRRQREKITLHRLDYSGPAVVNCCKASDPHKPVSECWPNSLSPITTYTPTRRA